MRRPTTTAVIPGVARDLGGVSARRPAEHRPRPHRLPPDGAARLTRRTTTTTVILGVARDLGGVSARRPAASHRSPTQITRDLSHEEHRPRPDCLPPDGAARLTRPTTTVIPGVARDDRWVTRLTLLLLLLLPLPAHAAAPPLDPPTRQLVRDIYEQLVEINTVDPHGDNTAAAEAMAARLRAAGFSDDDVKVLGPQPKKGNLVARLRGSGKEKPLLLLAHLDVVEARREDWSTDPFELIEKDGFFYGRGTADDKAMAAIWIATLIRLKREGFVPNRDLIVALTADEETGCCNGVAWLLEHHRPLIDAAFAINEGGGGVTRNGRPLYHGVGASEKVYITLQLEVKNKGGHSSVPPKKNAIYELADALTRIAKHDFPIKLNEVSRAWFARIGAIEEGQRGADMRALAERDDRKAAARLSEIPLYNARMRTTCVATRLDAGHADNALPQTARATINCRVLPGEDPDAVRATLIDVIANPEVEVTWIDRAKPSVPSPLTPAILGPIEKLTIEFWPGAPIIPLMATGASDGLYLRNAGIPTYGVSGIFGEMGESRAHGRDERVGVQQFYDAAQFLYTLVKRFSS